MSFQARLPFGVVAAADVIEDDKGRPPRALNRTHQHRQPVVEPQLLDLRLWRLRLASDQPAGRDRHHGDREIHLCMAYSLTTAPPAMLREHAGSRPSDPGDRRCDLRPAGLREESSGRRRGEWERTDRWMD